jgi:class III poly(R)-hydroxyalkanoic acid synthase PhaE subunit
MTEENKGPGNGAGDWIHAWVEQQREQLRRAATPGAQSTDKANDKASGAEQPASDAMKDLGMRWLEASQSYLQAWSGAALAGEGATRQFADLLARMPSIGLAREQTEIWRELTAAQAECQALEQELRAVWTRVQSDALGLVEKMIRERKSEPGINNYRELYDLWVECGEKVFAQVAHSESYAKLQAQVGNAAIKLRARQQAVIERGLKHFDLPTRSELNTVHKQMRELRERIATLEGQLADQLDNGRERGEG